RIRLAVSPLRGSYLNLEYFPPLTRWATTCRRCRDLSPVFPASDEVGSGVPAKPILARRRGAGAATEDPLRLSLERVSVRAVETPRLQAALLEISGLNRRDIN